MQAHEIKDKVIQVFEKERNSAKKAEQLAAIEDFIGKGNGRGGFVEELIKACNLA